MIPRRSLETATSRDNSFTEKEAKDILSIRVAQSRIKKGRLSMSATLKRESDLHNVVGHRVESNICVWKMAGMHEFK